MKSLKQEMREKYETHSSMAFHENNSGFEEGLLEKILNLAFASLAPYSSKKWSITAVKSPVMLHRLSKAANDIRISECAILLVVCEEIQSQGNPPEYENEHCRECPAVEGGLGCEKSQRQDLELLSLSVCYAAKYYCIDYFVLNTFDPEKVAREISLKRLSPAVIIGLGFFRNNPASAAATPVRNCCSGTVRVI